LKETTTPVHKKGSFYIAVFLGLIFVGNLTGCGNPKPLDTPTTPALPDEDPSPEFTIEIPQGTQSDLRWNPRKGDQLQIQFTGPDIDLQQDVEIYDLDLFETSIESIQAIHEQNKRVICYLNVGAWENWRPDADKYPVSILGSDYAGWPGEKWVDIRQLDKVEPIISARMDLCRQKGFDGIEPDNLDGYQNETGFDLSEKDQLTFNRWLAEQAHRRNLSIGLKNDPDQIIELESSFDFALLEDCFQYGWCDRAAPFIAANKPVFAVEYSDKTKTISPYCQLAQKIGIDLFLKNRELDAFRQICP
jgi:hypothetical protein